MQNVGVSIFSASSAHQAAASLLSLQSCIGLDPFLTQMQSAIQVVNPFLGRRFEQEREKWLDLLLDRGEKAREAYTRMVQLLEGLDGSWGRVRYRLLHHENRLLRRNIAARIAPFEIGKSLLSSSAQYLKVLLDEAEVYGLLPNVWQIIRHNMTSYVSILDEHEKEHLVQRNVDDCLAGILVYLLFEDFERVMGFPHEAKTPLLIGDMDVVVHAVPSNNATYAVYKPRQKTLFLEYLPDLDSLFRFQDKEEGIDFPEGGLIVQEAAWGMTPQRAYFEIARQVRDWFLGSVYLVLRDQEGMLGEKRKLRRVYARECRKISLFLEKNWGKDVVDALLSLYRPVQSDFLEAAFAYWRDEEWNILFDRVQESYFNTQVAVVLFEALEAGVLLADAIEQQEANGGAALSHVPIFSIQDGYLKYRLTGKVSYSDAWKILMHKNWGVIQQLVVADDTWRVAPADAGVIRRYLHLYAAMAQMALRYRRSRTTGIKIIKDYLLPLILFVTKREYHDQ